MRALAVALSLAMSSMIGAGPADGAKPLAGHGPAPSLVALGSLALPGTGQALNGKWVKAVGFFGAYAGFLAWGISINQDKQEAEGRLNAALEADRPLLSAEVDGLENGRNAKVWFAGLTLLLSMADAYVDAHLRGFGERIDAEVGFIPGGAEPTFGVRLTAPLGEGAGS